MARLTTDEAFSVGKFPYRETFTQQVEHCDQFTNEAIEQRQKQVGGGGKVYRESGRRERQNSYHTLFKYTCPLCALPNAVSIHSL